MIKFFRHIRQNLLMENKTGKYFKYAIGEIILVVIGILIALSINNWNQNRITSIEEKNILKNLNTEFKTNKAFLKTDLESNYNSLKIGKTIINLIGVNEDSLRKINIDKLLYDIFENGDILFSENTILALIQSGKFQIIKSEKLKNLIFEWTQQKAESKDIHDQMSTKTDNLINYLYKKYPVKNMDAYGKLKWKKPSAIKINKFLIFKDIEFENIIDDYLYNLTNFIESQKTLQLIIENIIEETEYND